MDLNTIDSMLHPLSYLNEDLAIEVSLKYIKNVEEPPKVPINFFEELKFVYTQNNPACGGEEGLFL